MNEPPTPRYPIVWVETTEEEADVLIGRLAMMGVEGIEQRDATTLAKGGALGVTLMASFATRSEAESAARALGSVARVDEIVGDEWRDAWKNHWHPTRLGERIVVVPSWVEYTKTPGDVVMQLDPGRAFGTGQHASTALAAAVLERRLATNVPEQVLDLGCGSGILAFAGLLLGVPRAVGCDPDPEAIEAARENAQALGLASRFELRVGGIEVISETVELIVANIEAVVLIPLAEQIAARLAPSGLLILSGILDHQRNAVNDAYRRAGLAVDGYDERDGWVAPRFVRVP